MKYIYFISDGDRIKIGCSKNPKERLKQLQTANSNNLTLTFKFKTNYGFKLEKTLHRTLNQTNENGEWFLLNENELEYAKELCIKYENVFRYLENNKI